MHHMSGLPAVPPILNAEPLPLDLLNTRVRLDDDWVDLLDHPANRHDWLTGEADRLGMPISAAAARSAAVATALKELRTHARDAIEPTRLGKRPPARALGSLNAAAKEAPATAQIRWDAGTAVLTTSRQGSIAARITAGFAEATMDLLTGPDIDKVRRCEAPACTVLFLASNPRRRWCTPDICGNRARVARYYLRHKD